MSDKLRAQTQEEMNRARDNAVALSRAAHMGEWDQVRGMINAMGHREAQQSVLGVVCVLEMFMMAADEADLAGFFDTLISTPVRFDKGQ